MSACCCTPLARPPPPALSVRGGVREARAASTASRWPAPSCGAGIQWRAPPALGRRRLEGATRGAGAGPVRSVRCQASGDGAGRGAAGLDDEFPFAGDLLTEDELPLGSTEDRLWLVAVSLATMAAPLPAWAFDLPARGENPVFEGIAGFLFTCLALWFFLRLLRKRAKNATTNALRTKREAPTEEEENQRYDQLMKAGPISPFLGSIFVMGITVGLWIFSTKVDASFQDTPISGQYAVRNITLTVRQIISGLCYLATFVFGANALGLFGLSIQMVVAPELTAQQMKPSQTKVARDEDLEKLIREVKAGAKASVSEKRLAEVKGDGGYQSAPARSATTKAPPPPPPEDKTNIRFGRLADDDLLKNDDV